MDFRSHYRVFEVDNSGNFLKESPLRGAVVRSEYLPREGEYITLALTRTEANVVSVEADLDIPYDKKEKIEGRTYRVVGVQHVISATLLIDLSGIAESIRKIGKEGLEIIAEKTGDDLSDVNPDESAKNLKKQTREMKKLAWIEKKTGIQHMDSYNQVYVQSIAKDERPKFIR